MPRCFLASRFLLAADIDADAAMFLRGTLLIRVVFRHDARVYIFLSCCCRCRHAAAPSPPMFFATLVPCCSLILPCLTLATPIFCCLLPMPRLLLLLPRCLILMPPPCFAISHISPPFHDAPSFTTPIFARCRVSRYYTPSLSYA